MLNARPHDLPGRSLPATSSRFRIALGILLFAAVTAAAGQIRVPLPFTPLPVTLQTIPVLLSGAVLGPVAGPLSQLVLLALGTAGLPAFTVTGSGPVHLLGAAGGYLIGFVGASWLVGRLVHGPVPLGPGGTLVAMAAGSVLIHLLGSLHVALALGGSVGWALDLGAIPFLGADLAKALVAGLLYLAWGRRPGGGGSRR
jgi:biotin transport system substrate-specific component